MILYTIIVYDLLTLLFFIEKLNKYKKKNLCNGEEKVTYVFSAVYRIRNELENTYCEGELIKSLQF